MRRYRGYPGHFIASDSCLWHLHTLVPGFKISSVGDYRPSYLRKGDSLPERQAIGVDRFYESMVFCVDTEGSELFPGREVDFRAYDNATEAEAGHEELVQFYERLSAEQIRKVHAEARSEYGASRDL